MNAFAAFFDRKTTTKPHSWQAALGDEARITDRLIRIPTGLGKTLGVLLAWLYHRIERQDESWPRRLVWCLPMRVLVEQTESEVRRVLGDLLWDGKGDHTGKVGVHVLMGGADAGEWYLHPEQPAVLIGTQDMLLVSAIRLTVSIESSLAGRHVYSGACDSGWNAWRNV
jgi:CRISPR-associated endonuclease/helicase Cas3